MEWIGNILLKIKNALYDILIWSSAADTAIIEFDECTHSEQIKHASIGMLLFITASVAGVAGGYMFFLILKSKILATFFGILWGFIFFFIDRSVVSSIRKREDRFGKDFWLASPRIFLACLAAIFVSYGMDLKFFESDINLEMSNHSDSLVHQYVANNNLLLKENFENKISQLKDEVKDRKSRFPSELQLTIDDYNTAKNNYDNINKSLSPINSNYYQQINNIRSNYADENKISEQDYKRIQNLYSRIRDNNSTINAAKIKSDDLYDRKEARLKVYQAFTDSLEINNNVRIKKIEAGKNTASNYFQIVEEDKRNLHKENTKLSARIASLDRVTTFSEHYSNWKTYWQIFLLFFAIEILPVLTKLFMWRGPYDFLLEAKEIQIESETKAKRKFFGSDSFANIFSYLTKFNAQSKSQNESVKSIYKNTHDFMKHNSDEHNRFVKFIQKRLSEIHKLDNEMNGELKNSELKILENIMYAFYKKSDKAFDEFNKE